MAKESVLEKYVIMNVSPKVTVFSGSVSCSLFPVYATLASVQSSLLGANYPISVRVRILKKVEQRSLELCKVLIMLSMCMSFLCKYID